MGITDNLNSNRIFNSTRNAVVGLANVVVATIGPFLIRTLLVIQLGDEYAGINSVIISIFAILGITDLSISNAIVYLLYKPIAHKDFNLVNAYLNVLKKVYRFIALLVVILSAIIMPFLPAILHNEIPADINVYYLFALYMISVALLYLLYPEAVTLLTACQRSDINSMISLFGNLLVYLFQIISIWIFHSLTIFFVSILIQTLVIVFLRKMTMTRMLGEIKPSGSISDVESLELRRVLVSMLGHQIDERLISSFDHITISFFWGLSIVTRYGNYMYVVTAVSMMISVLYDAMLASIGNSMVIESKESNYTRFKAVLWMNGIVTIWSTTCMCVLYQVFMRIWMGDRLFESDEMILFCILFYVMQIRRTVLMFKNANGMWWNDRYKPYIAMGVNIILDVIMVKCIGVKGALISSIMCISLIEIPWETKVLFRDFFGIGIKEYIKKQLQYAILTFFLGVILTHMTNCLPLGNMIVTFLIKLLICTVVNLFVILTIYRKSEEMMVWKQTFGILIQRGGHLGEQ